jgi:hypothetical protein
MQQTETQITGLVAARGMKTVADWHAMDFTGKIAWLAQLSDLHVRAQASVLAMTGRTTVMKVLVAWISLGFLPESRLQAVWAARAETGAGLSPAD